MMIKTFIFDARLCAVHNYKIEEIIDDNVNQYLENTAFDLIDLKIAWAGNNNSEKSGVFCTVIITLGNKFKFREFT
jgi:hypothetical protein